MLGAAQMPTTFMDELAQMLMTALAQQTSCQSMVEALCCRLCFDFQLSGCLWVHEKGQQFLKAGTGFTDVRGKQPGGKWYKLLNDCHAHYAADLEQASLACVVLNEDMPTLPEALFGTLLIVISYNSQNSIQSDKYAYLLLKRDDASDSHAGSHRGLQGEQAVWPKLQQEVFSCTAQRVGDALAIQEEQADARVRAEEAEKALRQQNVYFASIAHELRAPLHTIMTGSQMGLEGMLGQLTLKQEDYLQRIYGSGSHLLTMIDDILDQAKIQSGQFSIVPRIISLHDMIVQAAQCVEPQFAVKEQTLTLNVSPAVPQQYVADGKRLKQVLINLLSNAHKYTPSGTEVILDCRIRNKQLCIEVQDNGPGISDDDQSRIFEPFERIEPECAAAASSHEGVEDGTATTQSDLSDSKSKGTGLGLSIARTLVQMHAGSLTVDSTVGEGTTFRIMLPKTMMPAPSDLSAEVLTLKPSEDVLI